MCQSIWRTKYHFRPQDRTECKKCNFGVQHRDGQYAAKDDDHRTELQKYYRHDGPCQRLKPSPAHPPTLLNFRLINMPKFEDAHTVWQHVLSAITESGLAVLCGYNPLLHSQVVLEEGFAPT